MFYNINGGDGMKKCRKRRELSRIFEKYFRLGLHKNRLDVFSVCRRIRGSCGGLGAAKDLFAVWELRLLLSLEKREEELQIFEEIYLKDIKKYHNNTNDKVVAYSLRHYCDPRTVYRRLAYIEKMYYDIRETL